MGNTNRAEGVKTYKVYETRDGKRELYVQYKTSVAYVMGGGRLIDCKNNATIDDVERMVAELERYDGALCPGEEEPSTPSEPGATAGRMAV